MKNLQNTTVFEPLTKTELAAENVLRDVYRALSEEGYNPVNQVTGYIMSGDPTYITGYNKARITIGKCDRDELIEEILNYYIQNKLEEKNRIRKSA